MTERDSTGSRASPGRFGRAAEERFRLLVDSVSDYAIFLLDNEGRVESWNAGAERIKGYQADEIIGESFERFYPADKVSAGWPREELRRAVEHGRIEDEGWRIRKDGTRFWASVVITALRDSHGQLQGYAKVTRDLSERRQQEEALRRSEEQLRMMVEAVKDYALFMLDTSGRVLTWNSGAAAIMGYTADEVLLRNAEMFFEPDDVAAGRPSQLLAQALAAGRAEVEGQRLRKDGTAFWANVVVTPVHAPDGMHRGFAAVTRDLSGPRRLLELELASRRTSEFIAMLAHELRNPLAPIRNAVSVLKMQGGAMPAAVQRMGDVIDRQARHLTRLVDDLLDIGRIVTGKIWLQKEPIDYHDVVQASVETARPSMALRGHQLKVDVPEHVPMVGDPTRLAQALHNLLSNAARYTPVGGEISVVVRTEGLRCITRVIDNGQGIGRESLERVFELFEQEPGVVRDPSESGLGVGLTLARTMAELHGGSLAASSEGRGRGSTFELVLPCCESVAEHAEGPASAERGVAELRILVVDDNRDSADSMVMLLQQLGHDSRAVYGAEDALRVAAELDPALVLLDLNMPGASGYDVIGELRDAMDHPICVAAMTGYGQDSDRERTRAAGFDAHLTKPVSIDQLLGLIQRVAGLVRASASSLHTAR